MKLLLSERNLIIAIGSSIEYGVWGQVGNAASWKITQTSYIMDNNFRVEDIGDVEIPNYVQPEQYYYIDGEFKLADECPNEYKDRIVAAEEEITNTQIAMVEQYEDNLEMSENLSSAQDDLTSTQLALVEQYEANLALNESLVAAQTEVTDLQLALVDQYEYNLQLEERIKALEELQNLN